MPRYGYDLRMFRDSWSRVYDLPYARPSLGRGVHRPGNAPLPGRGYDAGYPSGRARGYDQGLTRRGHSGSYFMGGYSYAGDYQESRRGRRPRRGQHRYG